VHLEAQARRARDRLAAYRAREAAGSNATTGAGRRQLERASLTANARVKECRAGLGLP
jgi:hypothetical protein